MWATLFVIQSPECPFSSSKLIECLNPVIFFLVGISHHYPKVANWFRSLARDPRFSTAVWTASDDNGYEAFHEFIVSTSTKQRGTQNEGIPFTSRQKEPKTVQFKSDSSYVSDYYINRISYSR